jgi:hypothetical protein
MRLSLSTYKLILKEFVATPKTTNNLSGNPQIVHKIDPKNILQQIQLPTSDNAIQTGHHQIKTPLEQHHPNKVMERPVQLGGKILAWTKDWHPKQQKWKNEPNTIKACCSLNICFFNAMLEQSITSTSSRSSSSCTSRWSIS